MKRSCWWNPVHSRAGCHGAAPPMPIQCQKWHGRAPRSCFISDCFLTHSSHSLFQCSSIDNMSFSTQQRRYTLLLLAFLSPTLCSAEEDTQSLRGSPLNQQHQQTPPLSTETSSTDRSLYGMQYGFTGFQKIFGDTSFERVTDLEDTTPDLDPNFVGQQVFFDPPTDGESGGEGDEGAVARIVGGNPASFQIKAFTLHLRYQATDGSWHFAGCGGALISNCHVLTAAHCAAGSRAGLPNGVYVGAWKPFDNNDGQFFHFSTTSRTVIHSNFNNANNANDIAVITLDTCVDTTKIKPMKVADSNYMSGLTAGTSVTVMGFGAKADGDTTLIEVLNTVSIPYITNSACKSYYSSRLTADMICAGRAAGGQDSCQGDSGGPLVMNAGSYQPTIIGVVSWGTGCAEPNKPGVYASTAYHYNFIKNEVCSNSKTDKSIALCSAVSTTSSSRTCKAQYQWCSSSLDCCDGLVCQARDSQCKLASSTSSSTNKNSVSSYRRNAPGGDRKTRRRTLSTKDTEATP
jgi:trypsin